MVNLIFIFGFIFFLIPIGFSVFMIVSLWKVFKKAGKEGWESIIPIYNTIVLIEITGLPMWYIALFFLPFANIYAMARIYLELGYRFKQPTGFGVGLILLNPIFLGILAFNKEMTYEPLTVFATIYCSKCGNKINSNDKFCTICGTKVNRPKDICSYCGSKLRSDDKFCTHCGTQV